MLNIYREAMPPQNKSQMEYLRYLCQSLHPDTPDLPYLVGMWSYILRTGGLTIKQSKNIDRYVEVVNKHLGWVKGDCNDNFNK